MSEERLEELLKRGVERQIGEEETKKAVIANDMAKLKDLGYSLQDLARYYRQPRYMISRRYYGGTNVSV